MITIFHDKDDPEAQAKFKRWRQTTSHGYDLNYRSRSNLIAGSVHVAVLHGTAVRP